MLAAAFGKAPASPAQTRISSVRERVTRNRASKRRKHRPPQNNSGQDDPWAEAVGHPSAWNFKHGISDRKDSDDPTPLLRSNTQIFLNARASNRDANAVEICDNRQEKQERPHSVSVSHGPPPSYLVAKATTERREVSMRSKTKDCRRRSATLTLGFLQGLRVGRSSEASLSYQGAISTSS